MRWTCFVSCPPAICGCWSFSITSKQNQVQFCFFRFCFWKHVSVALSLPKRAISCMYFRSKFWNCKRAIIQNWTSIGNMISNAHLLEDCPHSLLLHMFPELTSDLPNSSPLWVVQRALLSTSPSNQIDSFSWTCLLPSMLCGCLIVTWFMFI